MTSLSLTDPHDLLAHYRATSDLEDRERLVRRFLPLARSLARRYNNGS